MSPPCGAMRVSPLVAVLLLLALSARAQPGLWPTKAHDARRTGQSEINGPLSVSEAASWQADAPAAGKLNIGATVTPNGVVVGSWGLQRRDPRGRLFWDKADGQLFAYDRETGTPTWGGPRDLDLTPRCYAYDDRGPNLFWCGFGRYEVSYYNGTVEGQPTFDASRGVMYVGRGDGKLYAVDEATGDIRWRYVTHNPLVPDDPDGGGEIVASPLVAPNGMIYVGTWGEGNYETNAFYAVRPDGRLGWRWPEEASLEHRFYASPALSPDGRTVYASTFTDEAPFSASSLYAFHQQRSHRRGDPLKWSLELMDSGDPVFTTTLAVGADGVIYVGGYIVRGTRTIPAVAAVRDRGGSTAPVYVWGDEWIEFAHGAQFVHGIGLREEGGETTRLYVTTANLGTGLFNARAAGDLYAVDPASGQTLARYDPSRDDPQAVGSLTSPAIGANGTVYVGVRGRFDPNGIDGRVLAVDYDPARRRFTRRWSYTVDGHIEWNHPAIGPGGWLYIGSTPNAFTGNTLEVFDPDEVPEGTTCTVYGLSGLTR